LSHEVLTVMLKDVSCEAA